MKFEEKYRINHEYELEVRDSKYLYTDLKNSNWFRTNRTGSELLGRFDGKCDVKTFIENYAMENGFPYSIVEPKITPFLQKAIDVKLLLKEGEEHTVLQTDFSKYPNELWIHVTDICNMHCPFCYSSSSSMGRKKLDINKILCFVEKIPYDKRENVIISGGEPMLFPELPELVRELKAMNFRITVISNGTVGHERYGEILPYLNGLQISIDGSTEEIYENTRGKGNFSKAVNGLKLAYELGVSNLVVSFTTNNFNIGDIHNMAKFARIHHVNHLHITKIIPSGRASDIMDKIVPTAEEYGLAIQRLSEAVIRENKRIATIRETEEMFFDEDDKTRFITFSISSDPIRKTMQQTKMTTCSLGCGTLSIGYDGNIYPCGSLQHHSLKLGSLDDDIENIMKRGHCLASDYSIDNEEMSECFKCKYKYICGGGCRACAKANGNMSGKDPMCDFYISRIESVMWDSPVNFFED